MVKVECESSIKNDLAHATSTRARDISKLLTFLNDTLNV